MTGPELKSTPSPHLESCVSTVPFYITSKQCRIPGIPQVHGALDRDRYYSFSGGGISYMNEIGPIMEVLVYLPHPIHGFKTKPSGEAR